MGRTRVWVPGLVFSAAALPLMGQGVSRNELKLGTDVAKVGTIAEVPLTLSTTDQVQGLQVAFEWDAPAGTGEGLALASILQPLSADTVSTRVEADHMVLGVVMDSDGAGNEVIPPGDNIPLATARIRCGTSVGMSAIRFVDLKYALVGDEPKLENVVVVGGLSIGGEEGLVKTNGSFECVVGFNRFYIAEGAGNTSGSCGDARVLMENLSPVEGYVVSLCHDTATLSLESIAMGGAATQQAADFSQADVSATGGTLGVVIDLFAPFTNNTIPVGDGNHVATYRYCCRSLPAPGSPPVTTPLTFCDNVLGTPLKENVIVVGGLSINPDLENGTFTCQATEIPPEDCDNGIDDDGDDLVDLDDPDCQNAFACGTRTGPGAVEGSLGGTAEVCFFVKSPEDNAPGHAQNDHIQGFSMAASFCCDLLSARPSFDIRGTILEALGAEFVSIGVDNPGTDEDAACELIIGVLMDALPPFDGATIPPLPDFQRMGCVTFDVTEDETKCGECCTINFEDGLKGPGSVPIKNLIARENQSAPPGQLLDCEVCLKGEERFFRGDCNFSRMGMMMNVDIADAAAVVSFLFGQGSWHFAAPCLDACDCNDDGRVDLADAICVLQFLFQNGRFPPAPGPGLTPAMAETPAGPDPTADKLDCEAGGDC